jgi:hypothetical protein
MIFVAWLDYPVIGKFMEFRFDKQRGLQGWPRLPMIPESRRFQRQ